MSRWAGVSRSRVSPAVVYVACRSVKAASTVRAVGMALRFSGSRAGSAVLGPSAARRSASMSP